MKCDGQRLERLGELYLNWACFILFSCTNIKEGSHLLTWVSWVMCCKQRFLFYTGSTWTRTLEWMLTCSWQRLWTVQCVSKACKMHRKLLRQPSGFPGHMTQPKSTQRPVSQRSLSHTRGHTTSHLSVLTEKQPVIIYDLYLCFTWLLFAEKLNWQVTWKFDEISFYHFQQGCS